jgi:hypothetical protein
VQCGRFGKELQILLKHPQHSINISNRIVDVKGDANTVVTAGEYDIFFGLSDARRVAFPNSVNAGSVAWLARNQLLLKAVQAVRSQMERLPAEALTATGKEVNYRWALSFGTCFDIANPHWGAVCIPELMLQFVDPCLGMGIARQVHALAHPAAINVI